MPLSSCPKCGHDAICVLDAYFAVKFDGTQVWGGKRETFCNTTECAQRFWYYPKTGRITKRNAGSFSPYLRRP